MSDSDCSNCDVEFCKYREYSYTCYLRQIKELKSTINEKSISLLREIEEQLTAQKEESNFCTDLFSNLLYDIRSILNMYDES